GAAQSTLREAIRREGWLAVGAEGRAACALTVWSELSIASDWLVRVSLPYYSEGRLLQVVMEPASRDHDAKTAEPPAPFNLHQWLAVDREDLDGSMGAVDEFGSDIGSGNTILAELSRLGGLARPRDRWDAELTIYKPPRKVRPCVAE